MAQSRNAHKILMGKPDEKGLLGSPIRRWEDNIKMDLKEAGYEAGDWRDLAQDRRQWRAYVRAGFLKSQIVK